MGVVSVEMVVELVKMMGLWRKKKIENQGAVAINFIFHKIKNINILL